jgi:hypothetical protein
MMVNYGPLEANDLSQVKANAKLIVIGTVQALRPLTTAYGTEVTVEVTQILKGQAGTTIKVMQASHLEPQDNYRSVIIADSYAAPLLLPGEVVFLFLKSFPQGVFQEPVTGTYYVRSGKIRALDQNPLAPKVNGLMSADFIAAVAAA